mmetsp:Transcript_31164/g.72864  ORF Transcript_31164/g.72864 Transcript_31164/m.72864 type:complete len:350 (-) Transcript_31164:914-1963(-)
MNSPTPMQLRGEVPAPIVGSDAMPPNVFGVVPVTPNMSPAKSTGLAPGVHRVSPEAWGSSTPVVRTDSLGLRRGKEEVLLPNCITPAWRRRPPAWGEVGERREWHSSRSQSRALVEWEESWSSSSSCSSSSDSPSRSSSMSSASPWLLLPCDEEAPPREVGVCLRSSLSRARAALVPALAGVAGEKTPREEADLGVWSEVRRFLALLTVSASSSWSLPASLSLLAARAATSFLSCSTCPRATCLRSVEFQWFLMALSVRPGRSLAISAHLFWRVECASMSRRSSSDDHRSFLTLGSSWLCHRSRICLPVRPGRWTASADQDLRPCFLTSSMTISSSSLFHGHLVTLLPL